MSRLTIRQKILFAVALLIGFIRRRDTRRQAMFLVTLAALATLFAGATFLERMLASRPLIFLCYWAGCAWLTLCAFLLALYDILDLNAAAARERRRLRDELRSGIPHAPQMSQDTGESPARQSREDRS